MSVPGAQEHHMALFKLLNLLGQDPVPYGNHVSDTVTLVYKPSFYY